MATEPADSGVTLDENALRVRIYMGESDRHDHQPLYKAVVMLLRERGFWGATVIRGMMGFGKRSVLHAAIPLRLSEDLPIVIEVVDAERKVQELLPELKKMVKDGLITIDAVRVVTYVSG